MHNLYVYKIVPFHSLSFHSVIYMRAMLCIRTFRGGFNALEHVRAIAVSVTSHDVQQVRRVRTESNDRVPRFIAHVIVPIRRFFDRSVPNAVRDRITCRTQTRD